MARRVYDSPVRLEPVFWHGVVVMVLLIRIWGLVVVSLVVTRPAILSVWNIITGVGNTPFTLPHRMITDLSN